MTQLVVHIDYRKRGIATRLLHAIWAFSDDFAWGLVTANPFTVRTLEKATKRRCQRATIYKHLDTLKKAAQDVPYAKDASYDISPLQQKTVIKTNFNIDHSALKQMLMQVQPPPWQLGQLQEGEEWLAFTFHEQEPEKLTSSELEEMILQNEQIVQEAYARMSLDENHDWAKHSRAEIDFIMGIAKVKSSARILDFGCGGGRHSLELASRGYNVLGIDNLSPFIERANREAERKRLDSAQFAVEDCRRVSLDDNFDIGLCLYDVIGSFPDDHDNKAILNNLVKHILPEGIIVVSVMNMELTESIAKHKGDVFSSPELLQELQPSNIMQRSGDIFDPEHFLVDTQTRTIFRKEQFSQDNLLSAELVVRDRRYTREELRKLCAEAGCHEILCRYVQAGRWDVELEPLDRRAKEILYIGRRK